MELLSATLVMTVLALTRRPIGLAVYAVAPVLLQLTLDGSNDTSAGLLIFAALAVAERRPVVGAGLLAVAVAFKPYALAWAPALLLSGGLPALAAFAGASVVLWLPVLAWGPGAYLASLRMADGVHDHPYASLATLITKLFGGTADRELFRNVGYASGALAAAASFRWARSHDAIAIAGTLVFGATLYLGYWATFAYVAAVAPILCWKLDGWVGRASLPRAGLSSAR